MSTQDRSRVQKGVPTGGQYAAEVRSEADLELDGGDPPDSAATDVADWADYGFDVDEAVEWKTAGFDPATAGSLAGGGLSVSEADKLRAEAATLGGYDLEAAQRGDSRRANLDGATFDDEQAAGIRGRMIQMLADARDASWDRQTVDTMLRQIGGGNLAAISGSRVTVSGPTSVNLPVAIGYSVEVTYESGADLYRVERRYVRGGKVFSKGTVDGVYGDQLGEVAYRASCFYDPFGD